MNSGINFINADQGGLVFRIATDNGNISRRADSIHDGVHFVNQYGVAKHCYFSSDMDYASEEGFADNGDAKAMWDRICKESN